MSDNFLFGLYVFMLAVFVGYQVISHVPALLHTPLMSFTNAISGISLVASLVAAGADYGRLATILGFVAVTCATINVVGGFLITDRMLKMFRKKPGAKAAGGAKGGPAA
jgi:NAD(P) transhydrogenase subunit alpha